MTKQAELTIAEIKRDLKGFRKRQELLSNDINDCKSWNHHIEELKDAMTRRLGPTVCNPAYDKYSSSSTDDNAATKAKIQRAISFAIEVRSECRRLLKVNQRIRTETDAFIINQREEYVDLRTNYPAQSER